VRKRDIQDLGRQDHHEQDHRDEYVGGVECLLADLEAANEGQRRDNDEQDRVETRLEWQRTHETQTTKAGAQVDASRPRLTQSTLYFARQCMRWHAERCDRPTLFAPGLPLRQFTMNSALPAGDNLSMRSSH
jgi:hypothetical protein